MKHRFAKMDQANLSLQIEKWMSEREGDSFHYRSYGNSMENDDGGAIPMVFDENGNMISGPKSKAEKISRLLFAHQTCNQRRLLKLYGQNLCLLDATYKTTKYSIPLFFIVVKTNVDYQIVGLFAIQDETTDAITEALEIFKDWCSSWNPKVYLVDNCEEEIQAIENVFPGMK